MTETDTRKAEAEPRIGIPHYLGVSLERWPEARHSSALKPPRTNGLPHLSCRFKGEARIALRLKRGEKIAYISNMDCFSPARRRKIARPKDESSPVRNTHGCDYSTIHLSSTPQISLDQHEHYARVRTVGISFAFSPLQHRWQRQSSTIAWAILRC